MSVFVYLKAARAIHNRKATYACNAIEDVMWPYSGDARRRFAAIFKPPGESADGKWGDLWGTNRKQCRVLALCLMAAMEES